MSAIAVTGRDWNLCEVSLFRSHSLDANPIGLALQAFAMARVLWGLRSKTEIEPLL